MSNFDPKSPSYVPPGNVIDTGDSFVVQEGNQSAVVLLASASLIVDGTAIDVTNAGCRGAYFMMRMNAYPASGSTTIALKLQALEPTSSIAATFASRTAWSSGGIVSFMVYPGISASAAGISCPLPKNFVARLSISSAATENTVTMSMSMLRIA